MTDSTPHELKDLSNKDVHAKRSTVDESLMIIRHEVFLFSSLNTISELYVENVFYGFVLEDPLRREKIMEITGFPCGEYEVKLTWSARYSERYGNINIPEIIVPNYQGIRIHPGNTAKDTAGCIMIGRDYEPKNTTGPWTLLTTKDLSMGLDRKIITEINKGRSIRWIKKIKDGVEAVIL